MRLVVCLLIASVMSSISFAQVQGGFKTGNQFQAVTYSGWLKIKCIDGSHSYTHKWQCIEDTLLPSPGDQFTSVKGTQANRIRMSVTREDGSQLLKTYGYNNKKGESEVINLWFDTPFMPKPFLKLGNNAIDFSLLKRDGTVESSGHADVTVVQGKDIDCDQMGFESNNLHDCEDQFLSCHRYFQRAIAADKCW